MNNNNLSRKEHEGRQDLIGEHRWGDTGQLILLIIFLIVWTADSFFFKYSTFLASDVSIFIRIPVGILILIGSGILAKKSLDIVFGEVREKPEVIRKGAFGLMRHPVYVSSILLYFSLILFTLSILSFALWLIIIFFYFIISRHEEKLLVQHIGDDYISYIKEVPMWIPVRLKRK